MHRDFLITLYNFACLLYGCDNLPHNLREEPRLRVFENRVLRKMLGFIKDEVRAEWRRLLSEELYDLYCSPNIVRVMKLRRMSSARYMGRMGEKKGVHRILVGKPERKKPFERQRL